MDKNKINCRGYSCWGRKWSPSSHLSKPELKHEQGFFSKHDMSYRKKENSTDARLKLREQWT